ncbi:MAG: isochorismatase family protein, partial [Candidatus Hodarchaeota archaeon]
MSTILLVIDMQLGNFTGSPPIYQGDRLLKKVKNLITKARREGVPIVYIQNCGEKGEPD